MMAFVEELENLLKGISNNTTNENLDVLITLTNTSTNFTLNYQILDDDKSVTGEVLLLLAYGILVVISLFGNTLVCHVVIRNSRMHTVTNFFIANLAIADLLLTVINVPFNIARNLLDEWPFGGAMCHLLNFSLMVSVYVSTFTLMGIALDRQQVLLYPLSPRMSKLVGLVVVFCIWLLATGLSLPYGLYNKVQTVDFLVNKVQRCTSSFPHPNEKWDQYLTLVTLVVQYVIPLSVIAITYGRIVRKLWVRTHVGAVTAHQQLSQQRGKRKSIKMLITVVVVFALCWMPINVYHILARFHPNVEVYHYNSTVFFVCHWIAISSTCYNPFVYCWLNETFRTEVKSRFRCCLSRAKRIHPGTVIDGVLLRSDRAYRRRQSRASINVSSGVKSSVSVNGKRSDKYRIELDSLCREQGEMLTEGSPSSDNSVSVTTLSAMSTLEPLAERPELELSNQCHVPHAERTELEVSSQCPCALDSPHDERTELELSSQCPSALDSPHGERTELELSSQCPCALDSPHDEQTEHL